MPSRMPTACRYPGCPNVTKDRYCPEHARIVSDKYNSERGSANERGYGASWRKKRAWFLLNNPLCVMCGRPSTDVDHIIPKAQGGTDDIENLQALCHECHSRKTAQEDGRWRPKHT